MTDGTRRPGRPRSEAARLAILKAAHDELLERGYGELTMEGIAARAGVGKQTIYRWWRSKAEVALDALLNVASKGIPIPDEGTLEADLRVFLRRTFDMQEGARPVLMGLLAQSLLDPGFADAFSDRFLAGRRAALHAMLDRAVDRGEISADEDLGLLQDMVYGVLWYRMLFQHAALNDETAEAIASLIARATVRYGNNCTVRTV
ncbi:TetR/AcrR family transcriptional regulator [Actinoallomurus purpureus]|uniref:TetR/AcrR family transcriptional regulator n=1 Tax=Actinoallomurus purpureus TaxID=478114 RepID=UPI002091E7DA|nr:TetR/AcrR family transcriptional regulator [Actinoallomurus purpureus]MCO6007511.1 TetR/AcrR family transcriptional regulator [Actinoallomurus purpureus]